MCHSIDLLPLVGEVPGRDGLFMSAGYNGESECIARARWSSSPLSGASRPPETDGKAAAANITGHGMATIVNITRCLAQQLVTGERDARLPRCFDITQERLDKAATHCKPLL